jgi:hypothetical protein
VLAAGLLLLFVTALLSWWSRFLAQHPAVPRRVWLLSPLLWLGWIASCLTASLVVWRTGSRIESGAIAPAEKAAAVADGIAITVRALAADLALVSVALVLLVGATVWARLRSGPRSRRT